MKAIILVEVGIVDLESIVVLLQATVNLLTNGHVHFAGP
jgi:hypothetical protein